MEKRNNFLQQEKHFVVDILFVLALFGVFAVSALVLITVGADVYQHTVRDMSRNYDDRTAIAYITEKVRQSDCILSDGSYAVSLGSLEQQPALILTDEWNGDAYCTYLYLHDGWLKELYVRRDADIGNDILNAGQNIIRLEALEYRQPDERLLSVSMTLSGGETRQLNLSLHCR
ncbi:MAG: DUF4860 domain-containing protein [Roseburia sp.]|nr:DUF4860 domain-containing protein [Roseburia sp.]MCM1096534.1 DUF4860 domain-containing protein [Ruminococcus flavefaciens]